MAGKAGMESLLRSMGLGDVLDAANKIAQSGAVPKILEFADKVGPLSEKLDTVISQQTEILRRLGGSDVEPGPGPLLLGPGALATRLDGSASGDGGHVGPRANGLANSDVEPSAARDAASTVTGA